MKEIIENYLINNHLTQQDFVRFIEDVCKSKDKHLDQDSLKGILIAFQIGEFSLEKAMLQRLSELYPNHTKLYNKNKQLIRIDYVEE